MTYQDGFASMVELLDVRVVYMAVSNDNSGIDKALMQKRYVNFHPRYDTTRQPELEYKPVMMNPARAIQVHGAEHHKLQLRIIYSGGIKDISYSGAYIIHWAPKSEQQVSLREQVARLCHEQWANWTSYLFSKGRVIVPGEFVLTSFYYDRWTRQLNTDYDDLSESEQDSDRKEADKFLKLILESSSDD